MNNKDIVIIDGIRTPIGKYRGSLSEIDAYSLGANTMKAVICRSGINPEMIDDILFGNLVALPGNVARVAALEAGIPDTVSAQTIDRQCASGLETVNLAAALISSGAGELYLAGGTESMTRAPFYMEKTSAAYSAASPRFLSARLSPPSIGDPNMVQTADNIARKFNINREAQDDFAVASHKKASAAIASGIFNNQLSEVIIPATRKKAESIFKTDESPRPGSNSRTLSLLQPVLGGESTITAGNSCPMNDGAASLLVADREFADKNNIPWKAKVVDFAVCGTDPHYMGMGPVLAVRKLLKQNSLMIKDIDLIELNEAFAAQSIACINELGLSSEQVNPNGGAIALGHPLGATGAVLAVKLIHEMENRKCRYGIVTMCIGGGQGIASLFESRA